MDGGRSDKDGGEGNLGVAEFRHLELCFEAIQLT